MSLQTTHTSQTPRLLRLSELIAATNNLCWGLAEHEKRLCIGIVH